MKSRRQKVVLALLEGEELKKESHGPIDVDDEDEEDKEDDEEEEEEEDEEDEDGSNSEDLYTLCLPTGPTSLDVFTVSPPSLLTTTPIPLTSEGGTFMARQMDLSVSPMRVGSQVDSVRLVDLSK